MTERDQITAFADDIDRLVDRYRSEFEISLASAVGVLVMKAFLLCSEAYDRRDELDDEDEGA